MRIRLLCLAVVGAAVVSVSLAQTSAEARPRGWQCGYKVIPIAGPLFYETGPYYYACYGRNLKETRARARATCRRLANCMTGACLPLDYAPRRSCQREP
jgi:hypothetical protein